MKSQGELSVRKAVVFGSGAAVSIFQAVRRKRAARAELISSSPSWASSRSTLAASFRAFRTTRTALAAAVSPSFKALSSKQSNLRQLCGRSA